MRQSNTVFSIEALVLTFPKTNCAEMLKLYGEVTYDG